MRTTDAPQPTTAMSGRPSPLRSPVNASCEPAGLAYVAAGAKAAEVVAERFDRAVHPALQVCLVDGRGHRGYSSF